MRILILNGSPRKNWNTALMPQFPKDLEQAFQMGSRLGGRG